MSTTPAATAAADPPLLPPAVRDGSLGLRIQPWCGLYPVTLAVVAAGCAVLWTPRIARALDARPWWLVAGIPAAGIGVAALFALWASSGDPGRGAVAAAAVLALVVAVAGGGPVTTAVLRGAERSGVSGVSYPAETLAPGAADAPARVKAGDMLSGGLWIGAFERAAVATCLLIDQPAGLAVVIAIKGLGRYPELRAPGAAERFIIGTFASFLWASAAAGVAVLIG